MAMNAFAEKQSGTWTAPIRHPRNHSPQLELSVSAPGDPFERQADLIADRVARMPASSTLGSRVFEGERFGNEAAGRVHTKRLNSDNTLIASAPPSVNKVLKSPGDPLDSATRAFMEPRFGHSFSQVRVHSGASAEQSARDVDARAYTVGDQIVFGAAEHSHATPEGRRLLAHELAHVVQNDTGVFSTPRIRRQADQAIGQSEVDKGPPIFQACKPRVPIVKQDGPTCWAAALYSVKDNTGWMNIPGGPDGYVRKYQDRKYLDAGGALYPQYWSAVAEEEGLKNTDEKTGKELSTNYFLDALGGSGVCRPLWMSVDDTSWAHAYAVDGINQYDLQMMDPQAGHYTKGDIRKMEWDKKFFISY